MLLVVIVRRFANLPIFLDLLFLSDSEHLIKLVEVFLHFFSVDAMLLVQSPPSLRRDLLDARFPEVLLRVLQEDSEGDQRHDDEGSHDSEFPLLVYFLLLTVIKKLRGLLQACVAIRTETYKLFSFF